MRDNMEQARIRRNLLDAGMNEADIIRCIELLDEKKFTELEKLLTKHRLALLDSVHKYNAHIHCLDYFTHTLKRS